MSALSANRHQRRQLKASVLRARASAMSSKPPRLGFQHLAIKAEQSDYDGK
jgi:hypothetical protein